MPIGTASSSSQWTGSLALAYWVESSPSSLNSIGPFYFWCYLYKKFNLSSLLMLISNFLCPRFWIAANMSFGVSNRISNQSPYQVISCQASALISHVTIFHKSSHKMIHFHTRDIFVCWSSFLPLPLLKDTHKACFLSFTIIFSSFFVLPLRFYFYHNYLIFSQFVFFLILSIVLLCNNDN